MKNVGSRLVWTDIQTPLQVVQLLLYGKRGFASGNPSS